jgi:hypothetical protein
MLYDYKGEEQVQDVIFKSYLALVEDIVHEYNMLHRDDVLYVYAPAYVAKEIFSILLDENDNFWVPDESENELLSDGENEVIITVDDDGMLFIESARGCSGKLKHSEGTSALNYVHDSFKKSDVDYLANNENSILVFGFYDDDKPVTTSKANAVSKESYTVNGKTVSKEEFDTAIESIEDEYYDSLKRFLLSWCEIQDELNNWRRVFY